MVGGTIGLLLLFLVTPLAVLFHIRYVSRVYRPNGRHDNTPSTYRLQYASTHR